MSGTRRRQFAAMMFGTGAVLAILVVGSTLALLLVVCSLVTLSLAYRSNSSVSISLAGWLIYYPLALVLQALVPPVWGYLTAALLVILISEQLGFEIELSQVLEAPQGVDSEVKSLASELARSHTRLLAEYVLLVSIVLALSAVLSMFTPYVTVLISCSVILMFIIRAYARE